MEKVATMVREEVLSEWVSCGYIFRRMEDKNEFSIESISSILNFTKK